MRNLRTLLLICLLSGIGLTSCDSAEDLVTQDLNAVEEAADRDAYIAQIKSLLLQSGLDMAANFELYPGLLYLEANESFPPDYGYSDFLDDNGSLFLSNISIMNSLEMNIRGLEPSEDLLQLHNEFVAYANRSALHFTSLFELYMRSSLSSEIRQGNLDNFYIFLAEVDNLETAYRRMHASVFDLANSEGTNLDGRIAFKSKLLVSAVSTPSPAIAATPLPTRETILSICNDHPVWSFDTSQMPTEGCQKGLSIINAGEWAYLRTERFLSIYDSHMHDYVFELESVVFGQDYLHQRLAELDVGSYKIRTRDMMVSSDQSWSNYFYFDVVRRVPKQATQPVLEVIHTPEIGEGLPRRPVLGEDGKPIILKMGDGNPNVVPVKLGVYGSTLRSVWFTSTWRTLMGGRLWEWPNGATFIPSYVVPDSRYVWLEAMYNGDGDIYCSGMDLTTNIREWLNIGLYEQLTYRCASRPDGSGFVVFDQLFRGASFAPFWALSVDDHHWLQIRYATAIDGEILAGPWSLPLFFTKVVAD